MLLVSPSVIPEVDRYAEEVLGIPASLLMARAGEAIADAVVSLCPAPSPVTVFCGGGNNGGDGYAAAAILSSRGYDAVCVDVFGKGQKSEAGKAHLAKYVSAAGAPLALASLSDGDLCARLSSGVAVDAVFGTGFAGKLPSEARRVSALISASGLPVVAADVPLGVNAENGEVQDGALPCAVTVCLSFGKRGLYSYPARGYCGKILLAPLGFARELLPVQNERTELVDRAFVLPFAGARAANTHKGSFGRALLCVGSAGYRGAACLAAEGAHRMGAGLTEVWAEEKVLAAVCRRLPETILTETAPARERREDGDEAFLQSAEKATALLIGCGCGKSPAVLRLVRAVLSRPGCPAVLDADAINLLGDDPGEAEELLKSAKRSVVLTPHPLEFARLSGTSVSAVQSSRLPAAEAYARKTGAVVVLKGASTVTATKDRTYVNASGSPALAKGGSGDVLAGMITALIAQGTPPELAAAVGVYLHGAAGDLLEDEYSDRGVLPSELPRAAARILRGMRA